MMQSPEDQGSPQLLQQASETGDEPIGDLQGQAATLHELGILAANRGEWYRYPINIRLVSGAVE